MAISHFTQAGTMPATAPSNNGTGSAADAICSKGSELLNTVGDLVDAISGVHALLGHAQKSNAIKAPAVYHQKPRRVLESPFTQGYLDRLSRDDSETAQHFYGYFTKLLIVQLRFKLRSPSLAEDAAQETLLRVLLAVRRGEIQFPERLPGFVRSVSENVAKEVLRKNTRFQQVPENNPEPVARAVSAELNCITEEGKQKLLRVLQTLSTKDQALVTKIYILEQDKESICASLNIDRGSLRVRQFRALARLRKAMTGDDPQTPLVRKARAS